jgi:ribonuclease HI
VASVGGIIIDPEGHLEMTFAWGLGNSTNNQGEAYAFLQCLRSINEARTKTSIAIGGSSIIINRMISKKTPTNSKITSLIVWIQKEVCIF